MTKTALLLAAFGVAVVAALALLLIPGLDGEGSTAEQESSSSRTFGDMSIDDAQAFDEFQLYWAGEDYAGLPLTRILRTIRTPPPALAEFDVSVNAVSMVYGDCELSSGTDPSCALPVGIEVQPICASSDEIRPGGSMLQTGELKTLRGVPAYVFSASSLLLWTEGLEISVNTIPEMDAFDVVTHLRPVNSTIESEEIDLPAPDFSPCD